MNAVWNVISHADQAHVLQALGVDSLPDPAAMNESQLAVLAGIIGSVAADTVQRSSVAARSAPTLAAPELAVPDAGVDWSSIIMKVAQVQAKMKETQMKFSSEELQVQKENVSRANKEHIERIEEHIRQMKEAESMSFWSKLIGWIATAATVIAAAAVSIATGGFATPLVVIAVIAVTMQVLEATGAWDKMLDSLADLLIDHGCQWLALLIKKCVGLDLLQALIIAPIVKGVNSAEDYFADLGNAIPGLNYAIRRDPDPSEMTREEVKGILAMAIMIIMTVVTMRVTASANMMKVGGNAVAKSGDAAVAAAQGATRLSRVQRLAHYVGAGTQYAMGGATLAGAGVGAAQGITAYKAAEAQAQAKEITAWLARLNQFMDEEAERLQKIMEQLNSGFAEISDMISGMSIAQIRISQSL